jgi:archaetidylinositol phosphate synthase
MDIPSVLFPPSSESTRKFREAKRIQRSLLADLEKSLLLWLARRTPPWINSDHLTALALAAMLGAGLGYWWSRWNHWGLLVVVLCLALNWLGDSLDGTLARFRDRQRPRYGFYVDHICDAFSVLFLLTGLAVSGFISSLIAIGLLICYLMLLIETCIATYTIGEFKMSFFKFGPTELRIVLAIGTLALLRNPAVQFLGHRYRLFDFGGTIAIIGMVVVLLFSVTRHIIQLYREERIP